MATVATRASSGEELSLKLSKTEIRTEELPPEFRFITHDVRLQEVIDKLGEPSRIVRVPINVERGLGYALVSSKTSKAAIVAYSMIYLITRLLSLFLNFHSIYRIEFALFFIDRFRPIWLKRQTSGHNVILYFVLGTSAACC